MIATLDARHSHIVERVAWSFVWLAVVTTGVNAWGQWSSWPAMAFVAPLMVGTGIVGAGVLWSVPDPTSLRFCWSEFAVASATLLVSQGVSIATRRYYSTDSAAFNQLSTQQLLKGHNPYVTSMVGASHLLRPAVNFWSYTANGGHVSSISYPAGSFLFQTPLYVLGVQHLTTDWLDLLAWFATGVLVFLIVPVSVRWIAPLLMLSAIFAIPFANGSTDALYLPFLVLAVWRWDCFATSPPRALTRWLSPIALGIACSIKQSPWFCVPFLLLGVALEAHAAQVSVVRTTSRYALLTSATFFVINAWFIVNSPHQFWHAVWLPFSDHLVADGQGLVSLALHGLSGGANLTLLSWSALLVLFTGLVAMVAYYPVFKRSWLFFLPFALAIPGRSLTNYLVDLMPVALIAALTIRPVLRSPVMTRAWRSVVIVVPLTASVLVAVLALGAAPLSVHVDTFRTADAHQRITSITVTVRNQSGPALVPNFMMSFGGGHPDGFWRRTLLEGSLPLQPGASATFMISPATWTWAPQRASYWLVEVYSATPYALSTSSPQRWPFGPPQ